MAYEGNTNAASYITAGIAGADALTSNLRATKSTDFTKLSNAIGDARALKQKALIEGDLKKGKAKKEADALLAKGKAIKKAGEDSKPRMAGILAAFTLNGAGGYLAGRELKKGLNTKSDTSYYDQKRAEAEGKILPTDDASIESYVDGMLNQSNTGTVNEASSGGSSKKDSGAVTEPVTGSTVKTSAGASGQDFLSGDWLKAANDVMGVEAGIFGYNAFNQSGSKKGRSNDGTGGHYGEKFGQNLTDMTIAEVMEKQSGWNDWNKYPTMKSWYDQGKIHAAGGFQFIGPTLQGVVKRSGIDTSRKFDRAAQQELFKFHALEVGNFSPWVGADGKGFEQKYAHLFK